MLAVYVVWSRTRAGIRARFSKSIGQTHRQGYGVCMDLKSFWFHHVQLVIRALPGVQNSVNWYLAVLDWKHEGQSLLSRGIICNVTQLADRLCVSCKD